MAQTIMHPPAMQETRVLSMGQKVSPGEGNGYPLPVSCLDGGASWATVHGVARSQIMYFTIINTQLLSEILRARCDLMTQSTSVYF